jgi:YVTN family beta-propeller protein
MATPAGARGARPHRLEWLGAIALVTVLLASTLVGPPTAARSVSSRAATLESPKQAVPTPVGHARAPAGAGASSIALSSASAGRVVRSVFVNYNSSAPDNFASAVWNWRVGQPAVDSATGQLWIPTTPINRSGVSAPESGPTVVYDPSTNQSSVAPGLVNSSAFAFDNTTGLLFATEPFNDSVAVYDPATMSLVGRDIPVGSDPTSIGYDWENHTIFVGNPGSANLTVIDGTTLRVTQPSISVGGDPSAVAVDVRDQRLYVALVGTLSLTVINLSSYASEPSVPLGAPATSLAFASPTDRLGVGMASSASFEVLFGSNGGTAGFATVGRNVSAVACNSTGSEFALAYDTVANLTLVNSTSSTPIPSSLTLPVIPQRLVEGSVGDLVLAWSNRSREIVSINLTLPGVAQLSPDLGARPGDLAYDAASNTVLVADGTSDAVDFLNASTLVTSRAPVLLPTNPTSVVDDPVSGVAYVGYKGGVDAIDPVTGDVLAENDNLPGNNSDLVVDSAAGYLWDLNEVSGLLSLRLSTLAGGLLTGVDVGQTNIRGIALDNSTNNLYVVNLTGGSIGVINASTGAQVQPWITDVPAVASVAYDPADQLVYALGAAVYVISPATGQLVAGPIAIGPHAVAWSIAYDPSREFLYVTTSGAPPAWNGSITVIDGSSLDASLGSIVTMTVGQLPLVAVPVIIPGSTEAGSGEIWIPNDASGTLSVIASPPQITFLAADPDPVDVGSPTTILLGFVGGAGASTVTFSGLPASCQTENTLTLTCTPSTAGTFNVGATVVDSLGFNATALTVLSVDPSLHVSLQLGPGSPAQVDLGGAITGSVSVSGGTGSFSVSWEFGDGDSANGSSVSHTYAAAGTYIVVATVNDQGGGVSSASASVSVVPLPSVVLAAGPTNVTDVNRSVQLSAIVSGGTPPGNSTWEFGDGTIGYGTNVTHAYSRSGIYFARFTYVDASGNDASGVLTIQVNPAVSAKLTADLRSPTVTTGTMVFFNATISGGTAPYAVVWSFGDGSYAYGLSAQHAFASAGTYTVTLIVEDAVGGSANATYQLTAEAPSTGGFLHGDASAALFLGLVAGIVIGALLLYGFGRRGRPPPSTAPAPYEAHGTPAPEATTVPSPEDPSSADWRED